MARYTGSVCRLCRREGAKLFLKGSRCYSKKCSFERRPTPPGQHGVRRRKVGEYGLQLREKQKVRRTYGVLERQSRNYIGDAENRPGVTGVDIGFKEVDGQRTDQLAIRVLVGKKRDVRPEEHVPERIQGFPTDVIERRYELQVLALDAAELQVQIPDGEHGWSRRRPAASRMRSNTTSPQSPCVLEEPFSAWVRSFASAASRWFISSSEVTCWASALRSLLSCTYT